jgi:hypothetical protein
MTEQRRTDRGRGRSEPAPATRREEPPRDPGAYIGRMPERATATIPGGVGRRDVRVAATATQPGPVRGDTTADTGAPPEGHREAENATDDRAREAGQDR